ncbi:uncharacterized protein CCOS01_03792 [Colletotrichum costaricense]|uniref:Uncharacterized protein n=1 Tax=Colletotrichum costaricense TaxID=1209916 RepID=A0AAJ0E4F7_9PEZI|nr:uncharacterized protein CCOS01_03792 [Colletotrichum costaricense]KAK1535040.1 hypothetical protein CCOS01_03792 [Colletotrichum costaricense]
MYFPGDQDPTQERFHTPAQRALRCHQIRHSVGAMTILQLEIPGQIRGHHFTCSFPYAGDVPLNLDPVRLRRRRLGSHDDNGVGRPGYTELRFAHQGIKHSHMADPTQYHRTPS